MSQSKSGWFLKYSSISFRSIDVNDDDGDKEGNADGEDRWDEGDGG